MMTNMFSIFDPSTSNNLSLNWMIMIWPIIIFNWMYWLIPSRFSMLWIKLLNFIYNEFKILTKKNNYYNLIMFISMFLFILNINMISLMPYIFTPTSHMNFNLSMALSMWISLMLFGWILNTNFMFMHLVPMNTPMMLMSFMVIIESISIMIRPWTLSIRLSANMLSGHLLLSLLGSSMQNNLLIIPMMIIIQNMLMLLEMSVAFIQSYVFSILSLLYFNEIK
uniref:ATP synthase subunit a n=1 Tax=Nomia chalybeata TaxID=2448184 RepID=A0A7L8EYX9_9HYME|nr:ATP synthase F0 subunit 6 [Nomia chalybeata]QOE17503.1 ATP synthase subunit 6 [Nomia chalybeata]